MKKVIFIFFVFVLVNTIFSQQQEILKLNETDFPGLKITREQSFDGSSLWGYINGGADIFLEYGFDNLLLQEMEIANNKLKVEFYRMTDPYSALGIYSVSNYKCNNKNNSLMFSCITQYQIQCAIGEYYISIINTNGSEKEQELSNTLFGIIISKINYNEVLLPEIFMNSLLKSNIEQIKYVKGILGVQNGILEWYDYFDKIEGYEIYVLPTKLSESAVNFSQIRFKSSSDVKFFLDNLSIDSGNVNEIIIKEVNGVVRFVKILDETTIVFIECFSNDASNIELIKKIL